MTTEIKARITANTTGFEAGLNRAQRSLETAGRRMEKSFAGFNRGITALSGVLAGGIAAGALDRLGKSALDVGGKIADAAKTAGIGAETLQEYRHAAKLAGIEQDALDQAVARFVKNLGEARSGNKAYAETFAVIGVAAKDTNEQALAKSFDHLAGIADQATRSAAAANLFGDKSQRMALLVEAGADSLAAARKEARDLGLVLGNDLVAAADDAGDRIDAIEAAMRTRLNKTMLENIGGFENWKVLLGDASNLMVKLAAATGDFADRMKRLTDQFPRFKLSDDAEVVDILKRREKLAKTLRDNQNQLKDALGRAGGPLDILPGFKERNSIGVEFLKAEILKGTLELSALDAALANARGRAAGPAPGAATPAATGAGGGGTGLAIRNPFPGIDLPTLKSDALAKSVEGFQGRIDQITEGIKTPFEALRDQLAEIEKLKPFAANAEQAALLDTAAAGLKKQMDELALSTDKFAQAGIEAGAGIADAFSRAIVFGDDLFKSLKRLAQQLAAKALFNFFAKAIGTATKLPIPGLAAGGPVQAGRTFLVGEQGPELFTPSVSGSIVPNGALAGGGVNVQVVNRFDVGLESVADRIATMTPAIAASVIEAVEKARNRPRFA